MLVTEVMERAIDEQSIELTVEVGTEFDSFSIGRDEWDRFVAEVGSDIYFTFDWCRQWWAHYGADRSLRLLAFRADGRLVGLMPMMIDRVGVIGARLRLAKFVGSDSTITVLRPAIAPGWCERVATATITHMLAHERCDAVLFGPLSGEGDSARTFRSACAAHPSVEFTRDESPGVHSVFLLPETYDKYLASLEKKARYNFQRSVKQLANECAIAHAVVDGSEHARECFDEFVHLHTIQWNALNQPGHFGDWPGSEAFARDVINDVAPLGRAVFLHLRANDATLARKHTFRLGQSIYWRLAARELGAKWDKLSIGNMALVMCIEWCIQHGITRIESGPGHYEQKVRHGATEFPITSLLAVRHGIGPRIRARLLCAKSDLLHLLYYRIWRVRIAPKVFRHQRPLWRSWMRTRL